MLGLRCVIKCLKFVQILPNRIINQTIRCDHTKEALHFCKNRRSLTMHIVYKLIKLHCQLNWHIYYLLLLIIAVTGPNLY